jgi:tripartite-type tricarboxylate transporter receptor subunit TctC
VIRNLSKGLAASILFAGLSHQAAAQAYPAKPVRMLVAFPAGGSADIVARIVGQKLGEQMGQPFLVENRPGAGGNIAFEAAARAEPDGYTVMLSTPGVVINPSLYKTVKYTPEDFAGIYLVGEAPLLIMVNPNVKAASLPELISLAKQKPGQLRYASAGSGSSSHLASEVFRSLAGLDLLHVPYKGGGPAFQDILNGNVEITSLPIAESMTYVTSGRVRALAQTGSRRSTIAPDIPTVAEAGIPGYSVTTWYVLLAPVKTPRAILARLAKETDQAVKTPEVQQRLKSAGVDIIGAGPARTSAFMKEETAKWAKLIKASGAQVE